MYIKISAAGLLLLPTLAFSTPDARLPAPPSGFDRSSNVPHGTLTPVVNYPTRNHGNRACRIYTPPGYSATRAEKYPVLYLLHGIGGNENAWTSSEGNANHVMDFLYSQAATNTTPMIVVMPMGNMTNTTGDTWQNFEDVLKNDLAPYVEKTYNASTEPALRGIAGLSMGGGQTLNFGFKNPTFFNWIGAFSSAPNTIAAGTTIRDPALVRNNVKLSFLSCGTTDGLINNTNNYHTFLDNNNINPHIYQLEQGQGHTPLVWNRSLYNFAQRIFKGATTGIRLAGKKEREVSLLRAGGGQAASRFLVGRGGAGVLPQETFSLDGRLARVPALPASAAAGRP